MRRLTLLPPAAVMAALTFGGTLAGVADPAPGPSAVYTLTVLDAPRTHHSSPAHAAYEFGRVAADAPVEHTFILRNDTARPVTVTDLRPSCACTRAAVVGGGLPLTLAPGAQAAVRVSVNAAVLPDGFVYKSVRVEASLRSVAQLGMLGRLGRPAGPPPDAGPAAGQSPARDRALHAPRGSFVHSEGTWTFAPKHDLSSTETSEYGE